MCIKLISLDTSTKCTGYSIFKNGKFDTCGAIDYSRDKDGEARLQRMTKTILDILHQEKPDIIVIEKDVVKGSFTTNSKLITIIGAVFGFSMMHDIYYKEYSPSEWRKLAKDDDESLPKTREELKAWSVNKVKQLYSIDANDDTCDAVLIGQAYINAYKDK